MKCRAVLCFFFLFGWVYSSFAGVELLRQTEIQRVMHRLFSFHIENKNFTPFLVRRCFKLYIEQFDPEKAYLKESEVLPYLQMSDADLREVISRMNNQDYSDFAKLNELMQNSVHRARKMRKSMGDAFLKSELDLVGPSSVPALSYAENDKELRLRQKKRLDRFYLYQKSRSDLSGIERKAKLLSLFESKARRIENQVLFHKGNNQPMTEEEKEHLFSIRLLKSFAKSLDTHTSFFSPQEAHEMRLSLEKQFEGVGVVLFEGVDGVMISELVKNSPAEQCGRIEINDLLVEIDGTKVETLSFDEVLDLLKNKDQKQMVLGFKRLKSSGKIQTFRVPLSKQPLVMNEERIQTSWEKHEDGVIGKITLYSFYESANGESCEKDIKDAIRSFERIGPLKGLVLDLRENSGGFLSQAVKVSGLFLSNGVVVISKYGTGDVHYLRNIVGRSFFSGPLVILTSKMSASAAEIVAQALQDYGVGLVVGDERTFGKGSIQYQTVTDEKADLFFKVTVGKYYTASGRTTQIEGVKADIVVPTHYAPYHIGERYLEYPLSADTVQPAFVDPLSDLDLTAKRLFQRKYMPYLQRVVSFWKRVLPSLKKRSQERLARNRDFQKMLEHHEQIRARLNLLPPNSIDEAPPLGPDLQMIEAVHIVKDMVEMEAASKPKVLQHSQESLLRTGSD